MAKGSRRWDALCFGCIASLPPTCASLRLSLSDRPLISVPIATVVAVAVAATAIKLKAQKRDAEAIYWVAITITRGRICVSIARAIVLIIVVVAVTKAALLDRHIPSFFPAGPSLHFLNQALL